MAYHHVLAKTAADEKIRCLFSDLSVKDLTEKFVKPYENGTTFFSGNDLFSPSELRSVQIIRTTRPEKEERDKINEEDWERIERINQENSHFTILSVGGGYEPEDIARAGQDLTQEFLEGPPGFKASRSSHTAKVVGWLTAIIASVIAAGLAKWLGWV